MAEEPGLVEERQVVPRGDGIGLGRVLDPELFSGRCERFGVQVIDGGSVADFSRPVGTSRPKRALLFGVFREFDLTGARAPVWLADEGDGTPLSWSHS